jgi:hypothetical protein
MIECQLDTPATQRDIERLRVELTKAQNFLFVSGVGIGVGLYFAVWFVGHVSVKW